MSYDFEVSSSSEVKTIRAYIENDERSSIIVGRTDRAIRESSRHDNLPVVPVNYINTSAVGGACRRRAPSPLPVSVTCTEKISDACHR
ncbi:hypothetical protein EVAR_44828_1 [Eumeta japonica]|uniref:Uncharacterized protein n=1 Tax=Eumeta variegata TaxID=151549 RepID=A0A4C1X993_EUMVA|nr:hypothetical protein EVAR_44828_1 [Eumeta japonica]